jgi:ATP-binding cassette, subfamily B, bacterial CvaB/MchF/RaxB
MKDIFRFRWLAQGKGRIPVIRQASLAECGLACLAMIASYWGWRIDLGTLRAKAPPSMKGATLGTVLKLAEQHGLDGRAVRLRQISDLTKLRLPALLHFDDDHFVVLVKAGSKGVIIHDPAHGRVRMDWSTFSSRFKGIAAEFVPSGSFVKQDDRQSLRLSSIWSHLSGVGPTVLQIVVLSILLQVAAVVAPLYVQLAVDEGVTRVDADLLNVLFIGFLALAIINCTAFFLRRITTLRVGQLLSIGLMGGLFRHMLKLPSSFYEQRHLGDVSSRFNSTVAIQTFLTGPALDAIVDAVAALIALCVLFFYGVKFALIVFAIVFVEGILHFATIGIRRLLGEDKLATAAREETVFLETIRAIRSIKLFGREDERFAYWQSRLTDMTSANFRSNAADAAIGSTSNLIESVGAALIIFITARAAMGGDFTVGMMMSFIAYQVYFGRTAKNAVDAFVSWRTLSVHLDRIADLALAPAQDNEKGKRPAISGSIDVAGLSFRYHPDEPLLLSDISMSIKAGETVAITGQSGEGKTTLLKLLLGLELPTSGDISYDGANLNWLARAHFVEHIATVMQDDTLLSGSIAENIAFFDAPLDFERIEAAAKSACIHADIEAMPMRYASLIGDMGSALSGGQKQRIMIARALYKQPKILFMDEGTSQLDVKVERSINDNISKLNITRVIVAHRPDTLRIADRVLNLTHGKLSELSVTRSTTEKTDEHI